MIQVKFKALHPNAKCPTSGSEGASGYDLYVVDTTYCPMMAPFRVPLGLAVEIPPGYQGMIVGRSSTFTQRQLVLIPGIIDSDYRGELMVTGFTLYVGRRLEIGERIAQLIISPTMGGQVVWAHHELSETARGTGGFGSTGK